MKKKPARKGRFFHALNVPRALCRTPRKGPPGQGSGDFSLPNAAKESCWAGSRGALSVRRGLGAALLRGKIAGAERVFLRRRFCPGTTLLFKPQRQASCARGRPCSVPGWGEGAAQRAGGTRHFLRGNAASLQAAAAGIMRTGTPVFRPGMWEGAAQRAGGTRHFLRRYAASLHAAAAGIMRTGTPMFCPGMWEGAAQRAGGTRPFLRRNAASFHAAASAAAVCGTDCKIFQKTAKRSEKKLTPRGDCAKL